MTEAEQISRCIEPFLIKFSNVLALLSVPNIISYTEDCYKLINKYHERYPNLINNNNNKIFNDFILSGTINNFTEGIIILLMIVKLSNDKREGLELLTSLELPKLIASLIDEIDIIQECESKISAFNSLVKIKDILKSFDSLCIDINEGTLFLKYLLRYARKNETEYICCDFSPNIEEFIKDSTFIINILAEDLNNDFSNKILNIDERLFNVYNEMYRVIHERFDTASLEYYYN